jgi:hypothetical protein
MGKTTGRKKRIIITTAAMLAIGGGAAFAYWSAAGTHDTTTAAGTSTPFTIANQAATGTPLSPGAAAQTIQLTVTNPGTGVQNLQNVVVTVANTNGSAWSAGTAPLTCTADDFTVGAFTVNNTTFTGADVAANGTVTGTVTLQMNNRTGVNQDGCKNAVVPLHFAAS